MGDGNGLELGDSSRSNDVYGAVMLVGGCMIFAFSNATAKFIVLGGSSELALLITRGCVCYLINGALLALRCDPTVKSVMLFRIEDTANNCLGRPPMSVTYVKLLASVRGLANALSLFTLFIAWDNWITIPDAIAIFVATVTMVTAACAPFVLGITEKISTFTVAGGALSLMGATMVLEIRAHSSAPSSSKVSSKNQH